MIFVDSASVAAPVRAAAESIASFVVEDLGLEHAPYELDWFTCSGDGGGVYLYACGRACIALQVRRSARRVAETMAHELRHHWQGVRGELHGAATEAQELDAREYAAGAVRRWGGKAYEQNRSTLHGLRHGVRAGRVSRGR